MNAGIVGIAFLVLVVMVEVFQHRVTQGRRRKHMSARALARLK